MIERVRGGIQCREAQASRNRCRINLRLAGSSQPRLPKKTKQRTVKTNVGAAAAKRDTTTLQC